MSNDSSEDVLIAQFAKSPLTEVTGIVGGNGPGGSGGPGEDQWTMTFEFGAWRQEGGPLNTNELIVRKQVSDEELTSYMDSIEPESIIRIRARVLEENVWNRPAALLDAVIGEYVHDEELNHLLAERKKPLIYKDAQFGDLILDRRIDWFRGTSEWNGTAVELYVATDDSKNLRPALECAHALWMDSRNWDQQIRDCIARDLLPLKNENWLDDDESLVTRSEFEARMNLRSVMVFDDGSFNICFDDDDLFWGHDIVARGSLSEGVQSADIHG